MENVVEESPRPVHHLWAVKMAVSEAKRAANQRNAKKSRGPATEAGKAKAALNSFKHGLYGAPVVIAGEDKQAYEARMELWLGQQKPRDEAERYLVVDMVDASWRIDRCKRFEAGHLSKNVRRAVDAETRQEAKDVDALVQRLAEDPHAVAWDLRDSVRGCTWLIERFVWLMGAIDRRRYWTPTERDLALRMCGKRPEEYLTDSFSLEMVQVYLGMMWPEWGGIDDSLRKAEVKKPEAMSSEEFNSYKRLMIPYFASKHHVGEVTEDMKHHDLEFSRVEVLTLFRNEVARLEQQIVRLKRRDQRDRASLYDRASLADTPEARTRHRCETEARRILVTSMRELAALKKRPDIREPNYGMSHPLAPYHTHPSKPSVSADPLPPLAIGLIESMEVSRNEPTDTCYTGPKMMEGKRFRKRAFPHKRRRLDPGGMSWQECEFIEGSESVGADGRKVFHGPNRAEEVAYWEGID